MAKFFQNYWIQLKFLTLIGFPRFHIFHWNWKPAKKLKVGLVLGQNLGQIKLFVKKAKKQVLSLGFFHILHREYLLKQKVVIVKPPEWKLMAIS